MLSQRYVAKDKTETAGTSNQFEIPQISTEEETTDYEIYVMPQVGEDEEITSTSNNASSSSKQTSVSVMVCAVSFSNLPTFLLYGPSSFDHFLRFPRIIAESISSSKSEALNSFLKHFYFAQLPFPLRFCVPVGIIFRKANFRPPLDPFVMRTIFLMPLICLVLRKCYYLFSSVH